MACTARSSLITGAWSLAITAERADCALLPTRAAASWLFMITITCWLAFFDSRAASAAVIGCVAAKAAETAGAAVTAADAGAAAPTSDCPATSAGIDAATAMRVTVLPLACTLSTPSQMRRTVFLIPKAAMYSRV